MLQYFAHSEDLHKCYNVLQYFVDSGDVHIGSEQSVWACKTIFTLWTAPAISLSFKPLPSSNYLDVSEVFQT